MKVPFWPVAVLSFKILYSVLAHMSMRYNLK